MENYISLLEIGADIGLGFDGDGDRVGFIDEKGTFIPIDKAMIIYIRSINDKVADKSYLFDVKCSKALEDEIIKLGGNPIWYRVGASWTKYGTKKGNYPFGGEYSGHMYFTDRWPGIDSGFYNGLRMLEILSKTDKKFSELLDGVNHYFNTPETKIKVTDDTKFDIVNDVLAYARNKNYPLLDMDGVRVNFEDGWALVRASNTGPNLTVRYEALTEDRLQEIKTEFDEQIRIAMEKRGLKKED